MEASSIEKIIEIDSHIGKEIFKLSIDIESVSWINSAYEESKIIQN